MLALLLSALIGAQPGPRGPTDFDQVIFFPRIDRATQFREFLEVGGERSVLLRSENWRESVHPLLRFDITRPDTAAAVGLDETGPLTLVFRGDLEVSCATVKSLERFSAGCADRLKVMGVPFKITEGGVTIIGAKDALDRVLAGYVLKGNETCAARMQGKSVEASLKEIAKWVGKAPTGATWKLLPAAAQGGGVAFLLTQKAMVSMAADGLTASATARGDLPLQGLAGAGATPYAAMSLPALAIVKTRADPSATQPLLEQVALKLATLCPACEPAPFKQSARMLPLALTGNAVVVVAKVKVTGSLRTDAGRFFAVRTAVFAETNAPEEAMKAVMQLAQLKGAKPLQAGDGVSLLLKEGEVVFGVRGNNVFASNDPTVLEAAWRALPATPGMQAHGAEVSVDPKLLAQALSQVPLMDAIQSTELAGALAAGAELGPLLLATERITGWADAQKAFLSWKLKAPPPRSSADGGVVSADAGVAADAGR